MNVMNKHETKQKKAYHTPSLQVFGAIQRVTLSQGLANGDAGQGMMR